MKFQPRKSQASVIGYSGCKMAVLAVPGSGKTRTLSFLAARLVAEGGLTDAQEVLIVTMTNSAAEHFSRQVGETLSTEYGLLPGVGYRVRTLHGLANEIVRMRPDLVGLDDPFTILSEQENQRLLQEVCTSFAKSHPAWYAHLATASARPSPESVRSVLINTASSFIAQAKDLRITAHDLRHYIDQHDAELPLASFLCDIYAGYQYALQYRGALDFSDLTGYALEVLLTDPSLLRQLQGRWPYILEDEAQDSSKLHEDLLRSLSAESGNWVRVGDPNQAIFETFTTASPEHLRRFTRETGVRAVDLPQSGRSAPSIIVLANALAEWSQRHPLERVRERVPLSPPLILPVGPNDAQPNPPDEPRNLYLSTDLDTAEKEREFVVRSIRRARQDEPKYTIAVLVPNNDVGSKMVTLLQSESIKVYELLKTPSSAREIAKTLSTALSFVAQPVEWKLVPRLFNEWLKVQTLEPEQEDLLVATLKTLRDSILVEDALFSLDGLASQPAISDLLRRLDDILVGHLDEFLTMLGRWCRAAALPIDQFVLTIGLDLFRKPYDLAVAFALAGQVKKSAEENPGNSLRQLSGEMDQVAAGRKAVFGLEEGESLWNPADHPDVVTVSTYHKAKGLEWDRVYLTSVNDYDFPSGDPSTPNRDERDWIRDRLNLRAEALAQLDAAAEGTEYAEGLASDLARADQAAERLRLLYVGITRARRKLCITTNTGKGSARTALALEYLAQWLESHRD